MRKYIMINNLACSVAEQAKRKETLDKYAKKQDFFVWDGNPKHKWETYREFKPEYCLRQVLDDEIVIEFDINDLELVGKAVEKVETALKKEKIPFECWNYEGSRSPHLHIHSLPIKNMGKEQRTAFKKAFVGEIAKGLPYDESLLTGKHLIALEYSQHWKGLLPESHPKHRKTGVKMLVYSFEGGSVC